jgi:hypothetical protein
MATTDAGADAMTERCADCDADTPHDVSIQLKTESVTGENAEFSREPYRVAECCECGHRTTQRMNNA